MSISNPTVKNGTRDGNRKFPNMMERIDAVKKRSLDTWTFNRVNYYIYTYLLWIEISQYFLIFIRVRKNKGKHQQAKQSWTLWIAIIIKPGQSDNISMRSWKSTTCCSLRLEKTLRSRGDERSKDQQNRFTLHWTFTQEVQSSASVLREEMRCSSQISILNRKCNPLAVPFSFTPSCIGQVTIHLI